MKATDEAILHKILLSVDKIEKYTKNLKRSEFVKNEIVLSATILQLILIGELSKKLSKKTKRNIKLPWKDIAGFRDIAVHDYYSLSSKIIWETIQKDLPILREEIRNFLDDNNKQG